MATPEQIAAMQLMQTPILDQQNANMRQAMEESRANVDRSMRAMMHQMKTERAEERQQEQNRKEKDKGGFKDNGKRYLDHKGFQNLRVYEGGEAQWSEWSFDLMVDIGTQNQRLKDSTTIASAAFKTKE